MTSSGAIRDRPRRRDNGDGCMSGPAEIHATCGSATGFAGLADTGRCVRAVAIERERTR